MPAKLAWVNFGVSTLGNLVTLPLLAMLFEGDRAAVPMMAIGEAITVVGMLVFAAAILSARRRAPAAIA